MTTVLTNYLYHDQKALPSSAIRPASALKIPLGHLSLPTPQAEKAAVKLLEETDLRALVRGVTWGDRYETIRTDLRGLATGAGRWRTGVLYTVPTDDDDGDGRERLRDFAQAVRRRFFDAGFLIPEPVQQRRGWLGHAGGGQAVVVVEEEEEGGEGERGEKELPEMKLKVTVVNTAYAAGPRVRVHTFDAEPAVRRYQGRRLAKGVVVASVAICRLEEGRGESMDGWEPVGVRGFEGGPGGQAETLEGALVKAGFVLHVAFMGAEVVRFIMWMFGRIVEGAGAGAEM